MNRMSKDNSEISLARTEQRLDEEQATFITDVQDGFEKETKKPNSCKKIMERKEPEEVNVENYVSQGANLDL